MANIEAIGLGTVADDGNGDPLRTAGGKINNNFTRLNNHGQFASLTATLTLNGESVMNAANGKIHRFTGSSPISFQFASAGTAFAGDAWFSIVQNDGTADVTIEALSGTTVSGHLVVQPGEQVLIYAQTGTADTFLVTVLNRDWSGWADYVDTQYTSGSPLAIAADTDTVLPNNAGTVVNTHKPPDVDEFYDGSVITGRDGDGILITVDLKAVPTNANTTYLEIWFDIGGAVGELYRRIITFPKGNGEIRPINFTVSGYTLNTWETNGATVYVRANGTANLYDIRYVITRTHKAR